MINGRVIVMRTNIEIDQELLMEAMKISGQKTKKATVHEALEQMVRTNRRKEFAKKIGKIEWEGNLEEWRSVTYIEKKY